MGVLIYDVLCEKFPGYSEYCQSVENCKLLCLSSISSSSSGTIFLQVTALYFFIACNELALRMDFCVQVDGSMGNCLIDFAAIKLIIYVWTVDSIVSMITIYIDFEDRLSRLNLMLCVAFF